VGRDTGEEGGRKRERNGGCVYLAFPLKCYKTHTGPGGQRERGRGREGAERGRHAPLPPKCYKTHTCTGVRKREREGGKEGGRRGREACIVAAKML